MGSTDGGSRGTRLVGSIVLFALGAVLAPAARAEEPVADREARLREMRSEITRIEEELRGLGRRESGLLGELDRLGSELRLREAEAGEVSLRLEGLSAAVEERNRALSDLERACADRQRYLVFRLREMYKAGPEQALRRLFDRGAGTDRARGLRYAAYLSQRDLEVLEAFRLDNARLATERDALVVQQAGQAAAGQELAAATERLSRARSRQARALSEVRTDLHRRRDALGELQAAAEELTRLVDSLPARPAPPALDVRRFKGLLDWPAVGRVSVGFGTAVHPRFKTEVPHPGWDLEAEAGKDIACVFDGEVVFAGWMRGYGLTAIVDHGGGLLSVYAHASVLLVGSGERVARGRTLGKVGDTGSLRGPFLYFELRVDGQPVDPKAWLRPG